MMKTLGRIDVEPLILVQPDQNILYQIHLISILEGSVTIKFFCSELANEF